MTHLRDSPPESSGLATGPSTPADELTRLAVWFYGGMLALSLGVMGWRGRLDLLDVDPSAPASRFGLARDFASNGGLGLVLGWATVVVLDQVLSEAAWAQSLERWIRRLMRGLRPHQAILLAVLSGSAEELLFRGVVQPELTAWGGPVFGLTGSSVLFGLAHGWRGRLLGWAGSAFLMGLGLGALAWWTGSLQCSMVVHGTVNGLQLVREAWRGRLESSA